MFNRLAAFVLALLLTGCANVTPTVLATAQPEANAAYIAGMFSRSKGMNFALVIRSTDKDEEYVMPMGTDSSMPTEIIDSVVAIKVRPGTYTITDWMTYATLTKEVISRKPIQDSPFAQSFTVGPGSVIHLGNFMTRSRIAPGMSGLTHTINYSMRIRPAPLSEAAVNEAFAKAYPNLATQPLRCLFCIGPAGLQPALGER